MVASFPEEALPGMNGSYLIITSQDNRPFPLTGKQHWIIGRGSSADIVIDNPVISRRHAMLQVMESGEVFLVDFGSRNGSFLNGFRVSVPVKLHDGDRVAFNEWSAEFHTIGASAAAGPQSVYTAGGTLPLQQRRLLSVLVMDIRDFTVLSRSLGEQVLSRLMGSFFARADAVIRNHFSRIDKYIGDALMALWFHDEHETTAAGAGGAGAGADILHPLAAALAVHQVILELNNEFTLPLPLRIGSGVNTGYAMVGNTGTRERADFTALGDTVNAAFRLESVTKTVGCDVVIGQQTYQRLFHRVGAAHPFIPHRVQLKGYEGDTAVFGCSYAELETLLKQQPAPMRSPRV